MVWAQERAKKVKSTVELGSLYHWNWAADATPDKMRNKVLQIAIAKITIVSLLHFIAYIPILIRDLTGDARQGKASDSP